MALICSMTSSAQSRFRRADKPLCKQSLCLSGHNVPRQASQSSPVTDQPDGTLYDKQYKSAMGYAPYGGYIFYSEDDGRNSRYVIASNGDVYIHNPFMGIDTNTWLKAERGEGDTLVVKTPQLIYQEQDPGASQPDNYYAVRMYFNPEIGFFEKDPTGKDIKFVMRGDSIVKADTYLLALANEKDEWMGYGDNQMCIKQLKMDIATLPAGVTPETYNMIHYPSANGVAAQQVRAAISADAVYLEPSPAMPDAWVRGDIKGNKVTFSGQQYLGIDAETDYHIFFTPSNYKQVLNLDTYQYEDSTYTVKDIVFSLDPVSRVLSGTTGCIGINLGMQGSFSTVFYKRPMFRPYAPSTAAPAKPQIVEYLTYNEFYGWGGIRFRLPVFDVDGNFMDTSKLYYSMIVDGQPYTFTKDKYTGLSEDMQLIPYAFDDDNDFEANGTLHDFYCHDRSYKQMGIQLIYMDGEDVRKSEVAYYATIPSGGTDIITKQPEGKLHDMMSKYAEGYIWYGQVVSLFDDGMVSKYVEGTDGNVYIYSPIMGYPTKSWIKATRADGDTLVVSTPQPVLMEFDFVSATKNYYYVLNMEQGADIDGDINFVANADNLDIKFILRNDSIIKISDGLMGLADEENSWVGYGDHTVVISPVDELPLTPPDDAERVSYVVVHNPEEMSQDAFVTDAAITSDAFYFKPQPTLYPDSWTKGEIIGNRVVFSDRQYLGANVKDGQGYHHYFAPVRYKVYDYGMYKIDSVYFEKQLDFHYDSSSRTLSSIDGSYNINLGKQFEYSYELYKDPELMPYVESTSSPSNPVIIQYGEYDPSYGCGFMKLNLSKFDIDGHFMDASHLYYSMYVDGKLYTFSPDMYTRLDKATTKIPVDFDDNYDFRVKGSLHTLYHYLRQAQSIGIQMVYEDGDDVRKSEIVSVTTTGITQPSDDNAARGQATYTDLSGRRVSTPGRGVYIKTQRMGDGSRRAVKVVK